MKRWLWALFTAGFLAIGIHGTYSYVNNYLVYRGFPVPADPPGVAHGELRHVSIYSAPLHKQDSYLIYLPPGYSDAAQRGVRFPVLYLLHGTSSGAEHYIQVGLAGVSMDKLVASHQVQPFLIVMPEANDGTFLHDTEWANTAHGPYESALLDVVRQVDATWPTIANRRGRALAGLSMGGFGSINIWLHHLDQFSVAESWSGYFFAKGTGPFAHEPQPVLDLNTPAFFAPTHGPQVRRSVPNHVLLYSAADDHLTPEQAPFAAVLRSLGVSVQTRLFSGQHSWALWRREMPLALRFAATWLSHA